MTKETRLRVFERPDGYRFVKQMTEEEVKQYLADNPELTLVR